MSKITYTPEPPVTYTPGLIGCVQHDCEKCKASATEVARLKDIERRYEELKRHGVPMHIHDALKEEVVVLTNAIWKACGDDEEVVNATIESQRD